MSDVTLYLGDCLEYMRGMEAGSVDCIVTDMPYGDINHIERLHERAKYAGGPIRNLHKGSADVVNFDWDEMFFEMERIFTQWAYIFAGDKTGHARTFFSSKDCMTRIGVWEKINPTPLHGQYIWLSSIELCAIARKHGGVFHRHCKSPVWRYSIGSSKIHPTEKPLMLMREIIESSTNPGDIIFDPFMGSGTTGEAAIMSGRRFIGCEIDPGYFAIAEKRIAEAQLQPRLFQDEPAMPKAKQGSLL